ncbi:DNA (cytosine-5-)-methyltransferase [Allocoprobacillus halotolerans]|uniref:Cytosine-specific methyltransferase n=1 Tax=Allocoprobacillus halotolerans TaxID=2944914 RepID=A0ABY5I1U2_9FIRM|nr:DNA (cytosine-5-)-methyltransferase [Allocoprobacillus halotolerans]UTY39294.1 DNA (cytosine-5-)-methyltransferase [Allocoprobacillus halotolerans]
MSIIKCKDSLQNENKIIKLFDLPKEVHNDLERQRRVYSVKGISPTVLARSDSTKIYIDKEKSIRKITPEENFYIQGFEKDFVENIDKIGMSATQMYKQSGNAVSPPVIKDIFKKLVETQEDFKFIDLFSGLGGFRIAMEEIGGKCVFSSEIDKYAAETYKDNFGSMPRGDITKIDGKEVPDHDILCAGFPCQPFSIAGKRLGFEDTRGTLFFDVLRIIKDKKPKAFFLENVAGLKSHDNGRTLNVIEESLKKQDYYIDWRIINAKDVGIPQNRNRWYCVGVRKDLVENDCFNFSFPSNKPLEYTIDDVLEEQVSDEYAISDVAKNNINAHIAKFLNSNRYDKKHKIIATEIRKSKCNFRCDGISPCLTAKMGTGGNNIPVLVEQNRKLTERECLRIMGFPERYCVKLNSYQSYKQIGNSVVIPVIKEIATELKKYL